MHQTNSNGTGMNDSDLVLAAIENSMKLKKGADPMNVTNTTTGQIVAPAFATPCNPRLKELKRNEPSAHYLNNSSNTPNQASPLNDNSNKKFSTPVWMKPQGDNKDANIKFNFDYELAMEHLKTPANDNMNKSRLLGKQGGDTPLDELFMNAIQIACERNRKGLLHYDPDDSPQFEYSFNKEKKKLMAGKV